MFVGQLTGAVKAIFAGGVGVWFDDTAGAELGEVGGATDGGVVAVESGIGSKLGGIFAIFRSLILEERPLAGAGTVESVDGFGRQENNESSFWCATSELMTIRIILKISLVRVSKSAKLPLFFWRGIEL